MPTPSEICKTAVVVIKRDVLPEIISPIELKIKELEEKIKQLEYIITKIQQNSN